MSGVLLAVPVALPLLAAGVLLFLADARWQRAVGILAHVGVGAVGAVLLAGARGGHVHHVRVGDWGGGVSIVLAADTFSALLVLVTAVLVVVCLWFAAVTGDDRHRLFLPLAMAMTAGVYGAYLTADLFNLFVFIEVMLAPSYVLLVMAGGRKRIAAGRVYLTVSLMSSTTLLVGIGLIYGQTGTVNLGALAGTAAASPLVALAGAVVLVALALKAGVVPLHTWLPRSYPFATPAVTALFSGLLTKVGVYAIFRIYAVVFDGDPTWQVVAVGAAVLSMLLGAIGSIGEKTMRAVLVVGMVSHIGYMLVGPALFTQLALTAAIFYFIHHVLVKAGLLMCAGAIETTFGTGALDRLGGLANRAPLLAATFMVGASSLIGVPPLSGFIAKYTVIRASVAESQWLLAVVAAVAGVLTLVAMIRVWNNVFWGDDGEGSWDALGAPLVSITRVRNRLVLPATALVAFSLILGLGAQPLLAVAGQAAAGLLDTSAYVTAVTGP